MSEPVKSLEQLLDKINILEKSLKPQTVLDLANLYLPSQALLMNDCEGMVRLNNYHNALNNAYWSEVKSYQVMRHDIRPKKEAIR